VQSEQTRVSHVRSNWLVDIIYSLFLYADQTHFCLQLVMRSHKTVRLLQDSQAASICQTALICRRLNLQSRRRIICLGVSRR
jgi:hypothetical protein